MRVLVTGSEGYIGAVLVSLLESDGIEVVGLDSGLFRGCDFGRHEPSVPQISADLRDVEPDALLGFDGIVHLAALSNDPLGDLDPELTWEINHRASVRLAEMAKAAGVSRFAYSSSCSVYGAADPDDVLAEGAPFAPVTAYARSKVQVEADVASLAGPDFSPTFLRNATVYGVSPRLRGDLVVNNLVGWALTTGRVLMKSDGSPWRPLVHVQDVARAFVAVLRAERERVHCEAFNVGREGENYRIRDVAELVGEALPESRIEYAAGGGPDPRCYRVDFSKIAAALPEFRPSWDVRSGVAELVSAFRTVGLSRDDLEGERFSRIARIRRLLADGRLGADLRFTTRSAAGYDA